MSSICSLTWAQGGPFNCDVVFYQMRNIGNQSLLLKFASVSSTVTPTSVYTASQTTALNAIGYNPVDNYMYGIRATGAGEIPQLYRIGATGYQAVGQINNIAGSTLITATFVPTAGVFDAAGRYYFAGQATNISPPAIFRVDFIPLTGAMTVAQQYNLSATAVNPGDFDFNGAGSPSGLLLAATANTFQRFTLVPNNTSPALGTATVATSTLAVSAGSVGSAFYDAFASKFYTFDNNASTFAEITNPTGPFGSQATVPTAVPAYTGPPAFTGAVTPTDGTSCPISGSRVADMSITKSDGVTNVSANSITSYSITVSNAGPYPANYAILRDPAVAGLTKTSVSCTAPGGPPSAVCPPTLSITNLESAGGQQITVFPPGTSLVFTVNAQVTASAGSNVTNTATISVGPDFTDPNLADNTATDVDTVVAANALVITGPQQCPAGTTESPANLVSNGDFSTNVFASAATIGAQNTYGAANYVARQTGVQSYATNGVLQNAFPGDASRTMAGGPNWLLSNGKNPTGNYNVWLQPVTALTVGRVYQVMTYMSNATRPTTASPTLPDLRLQVTQGGVTTTLASASATFSNTGGRSNNETGSDTWTLVQGTFTASATAVTLSIADFSTFGSAADTGDVAALAQIALRACLPTIDLSITKSNGGTTVSSLATTTYTIVIANSSAAAASNTLVTDPPASNLAKISLTCAASAGSTCPASLAVLTFESPGLVVPLVAATTGRVTLTLVATVSGSPGSTATNAVTMSPIDYIDSNLANNQAQDTDLIQGSADLRVSKTNGTSTVAAGGTTGYTLTVSNFGPSTVNGAALKDPSVTGLLCSSVACTGVTGATSCPAGGSTTIAALQGVSGIPLPSMLSPATISFFVTCGITATGQ